MPSDSNGAYSLPGGYLAVGGNTIQPSQHNPPLEDIAAALTARLMRSGAGGMTGPLKGYEGTVSAPGYTFGTALTTGLYKTTDGIGVSIGGVLVAEFGSSGLLSGVPTAALDDQAVTYPKIQQPSAASRLLGSNSNPALTITGVANNGSGLVRLTVASTSTFSTGQKKIVAGVTGTTEANGRWTITVVDGAHIDLQGSTFTNAWVSGGTIGGGVDEIQVSSGLLLSGDTLTATLNPTLVPNYISGLTLSTAGSSSTISIAAGAANDSTNTVLMKLASAISKTTASWAVGTGNGGLDTGSIANNTWYHFFEIERPDTGVVDALFSLSASSPTMPTNYTLKRRIGSARTNGSAQWTKFTQTGDTFIWDTAVTDANSVAIATGSRSLRTLTVPTGVAVKALYRAGLNSATGTATVALTSPQESDQSPSSVFADLSVVNGALANGSFATLTDTSAQIGQRGNATNAALTISTYGWIDTRGK